MRRMLPILCGLALVLASQAQSTLEAGNQPASTTPRSAANSKARASRFSRRRTIPALKTIFPTPWPEPFAIPLAPSISCPQVPTCFRALVLLWRRVKHSCHAAFHSANDPNPADFNDQAWLDSFYTLDGKTIAALSHTEYHGWAHSGECHTQNYNECEYDSDTYHVSQDGGYHFESFKAPANFLAGIPYKYEIDRGPMGYSVDTNVVNFNGWYYAIATDWSWPPNCSGNKGPHRCTVPSGGAPIRTTDVFDPSSWRGWNGTDFSLTFVDPYPSPVSHPKEHIYTPVPYMFAVGGINVYQSANVVVATLWDYWDHELQALRACTSQRRPIRSTGPNPGWWSR